MVNFNPQFCLEDKMKVFMKPSHGYDDKWVPFTIETSNSTLIDPMSVLNANSTQKNHSTFITSIGAISSTGASRVLIKTSRGMRIFNFGFRCNEHEEQPSENGNGNGNDNDATYTLIIGLSFLFQWFFVDT